MSKLFEAELETASGRMRGDFLQGLKPHFADGSIGTAKAVP